MDERQRTKTLINTSRSRPEISNLTPTIKSIQNVMRQHSGVDGDAQRISQLCWLLFLKVFDALKEALGLTRDAHTSPIPGLLRWRN